MGWVLLFGILIWFRMIMYVYGWMPNAVIVRPLGLASARSVQMNMHQVMKCASVKVSLANMGTHDWLLVGYMPSF